MLSGAYTGEFAPSVSGALPGFLFNPSYGSDIIYLLYEVQSISTNGLSGNKLKFANYLNNSCSDKFRVCCFGGASIESTIRRGKQSISCKKCLWSLCYAADSFFVKPTCKWAFE